MSLALTTLMAPRSVVAASTVLDVAEGTVHLKRGDVERVASDGEVLLEGDELRTGPDSRAVVVFFDGSNMTLEPGTTVRFETAHADRGATIISILQSAGSTWHALHRLLEPNSRYEVRTPAMTATVRGTAFGVSVGESEDEVASEEGTVEVVGASSAVRLTAGLRTRVRRGESPANPDPAPRPSKVLVIDLVGAGALVADGSRRVLGMTPSGQMRNAIPGARVQRLEGGVIRVWIPNPTRDLRLSPAPGLRTARYALLGASGEVLASGETQFPRAGAITEVFERLRDLVSTRETRTTGPEQPRSP